MIEFQKTWDEIEKETEKAVPDASFNEPAGETIAEEKVSLTDKIKNMLSKMFEVEDTKIS